MQGSCKTTVRYGGLLQVLNLTSFALALLLVFRTTNSYNRWWEARILWGSHINMTRDIVRKASRLLLKLDSRIKLS